MTDGTEDRHWIDDYRSGGFCIALVEGLTPESVLEAYGVDAGEVRPMDLEDTLDWIDEEELDEYAPLVRAGQLGSWSFAFESPGFQGIRSPVLRRLSQHGRAASYVESPGEVHAFIYYIRGDCVTMFEGPAVRQGSDPDRLLPSMRRVGLDPDEGVDGGTFDFAGAALRLMRTEFGVHVPGAAVRGPLLTGLIKHPWPDDPIPPPLRPAVPTGTLPPPPPPTVAEPHHARPAGPPMELRSPRPRRLPPPSSTPVPHHGPGGTQPH